jgi:DNA-binding transcriptional ArsR family regulator
MTKETCIRAYANPVQIRECKKKLTQNEKTFSQLAHILSLAGSDVRLKILFLLKEENELCPCDIADILGMTVPAISQHLRKMKDGRIIETRRVGQTIYYSLSEENLKILKPFFKYITQSIKEEAL